MLEIAAKVFKIGNVYMKLPVIMKKTARMLVLKRCAIKSDTSGMAFNLLPIEGLLNGNCLIGLSFTFVETFLVLEIDNVIDMKTISFGNLLINLKDTFFEPAVGSGPNLARMCP